MVKACSPGCTQMSVHTCKLHAHTHKVTLRCCSTLEIFVTSDIQGRQEHYQWNTAITKQGFVSLWERAAMVQSPFAKSQSSHDTRYFMALHSSITRLLHHPLLNCPRPAQTELGRQCPKILTLHIQLTFSTFQNVPFNDSFSFSPQPHSPRTHN